MIRRAKKMDVNKKKKQICIFPYGDLEKIENKIVDKVSFGQGPHSDTRQFIMTFKDDTYIVIELERDENDEDEYILTNGHIVPPQCYATTPPYYFDSNGNLKFEEYIQRQIDLDLIYVSENEVKELIKTNEEKRREREYKLYLELKEKFEKE